jgi:uncharacterized protein (TIGR03086 family)
MNPDLTPATEMLAKVVTGIGDDQLGAATPCHGGTVAALLDHVDGLCLAFTGAAVKDLELGSQAPVADASRLAPGWRERIPERLTRLAAAWNNDDAWAGLTRAGGLDMPAEVTGRVAANEVVVHGWDLAVATGQATPVMPRCSRRPTSSSRAPWPRTRTAPRACSGRRSACRRMRRHWTGTSA